MRPDTHPGAGELWTYRVVSTLDANAQDIFLEKGIMLATLATPDEARLQFSFLLEGDVYAPEKPAAVLFSDRNDEVRIRYTIDDYARDRKATGHNPALSGSNMS